MTPAVFTKVLKHIENMPKPAQRPCRVYWGSHGCRFERGHVGAHECRCADLADEDRAAGILNVGAAPYYGPETQFYGEDA
jgi:hypothetical protein